MSGKRKLDEEKLRKFIAVHPEWKISEIAKEMGLSGTTIGKAIGRHPEWGYVQKDNHPKQRKRDFPNTEISTVARLTRESGLSYGEYVAAKNL